MDPVVKPRDDTSFSFI
nr:hypothetical protein [Rickettsia asembonensis]